MYKPEWLPYISICENFFFQFPPFDCKSFNRKHWWSKFFPRGGGGIFAAPAPSCPLVLSLLLSFFWGIELPSESWGELIFFLIKKNFFYWLRWVFIAACGLSLVVVSGGFSCCRAQALGLRALVFVACGLSSCNTWALEHVGFCSCGAWA